MSTMSNLGKGLSKKIGPLKAWQWGMIAGGGILVFTILKKNGLSVTGKSAEEVEQSSAGLYDAGTSVSGTGTSGGGSDNGTAPQPIQITITPAEPDDSENKQRISDLEKQLAAQKERERTRVSAWKNWGQKWKTQAAKNARRKAVTPKQKKAQTTTKRKAKLATPGGKVRPTVQRPRTRPELHPRKPSTSAKRSGGTRTIARTVAQKKVLKPRTVPAKRKK